jgi:hypothetical protein
MTSQLEKASCTGAPGERDFHGEGRARKNGEGGYTLSFSMYEKEGYFFLLIETDERSHRSRIQRRPAEEEQRDDHLKDVAG